MYTRILMPTDGSREARIAIPHVVALATLHRSSVIVVGVVETEAAVRKRASTAGWAPAGTGFVTDENIRQVIEVERRAARQHIDAIERELRAAGVDEVETLITEGQPGPTLVATASERGCDAIVMSSHGRSGVMRVLLGSVAEHVARHAACTVVVIREGRRRP